LAASWEQVSVETIKVLYGSITASREAKQAPCEPKQAPREPQWAPREPKLAPCKPISVSIETNSASRQYVNVVLEATKVPCEPKTTSNKAMWVVKSTTSSLDPASYEVKIVSDHETISAPHRAKPRLSCEVKAKTLCTNSEAAAAPLASSTLLGSAKLA